MATELDSPPVDARINPKIMILAAGFLAEAILPWLLIWLSDFFYFDIPTWSLWLLFTGPLVLTGAALLILFVRAKGSR